MLALKRKVIKSDNRINIKLDPHLSEAIASEIRAHPEWGMNSVSEFVRRAIDDELNMRRKIADRKVIELSLKARGSRENSRDRDL